MAFDKSKWALASNHYNSNIRRVWNYTSDDTQAAINSAGYFNSVASELSVGDKIVAWVDADGTPAAVAFYVNANDGSIVDVTDGVVEVTTDTD